MVTVLFSFLAVGTFYTGLVIQDWLYRIGYTGLVIIALVTGALASSGLKSRLAYPPLS